MSDEASKQCRGAESMVKFTRRSFFRLVATTPLAGLVGCRSGCPSIFGYQLGAGALYDSNIDTVFVHAFNNRALQTSPYRGMEADMTQAVIDQIGMVTPFHICSDCSRADTELLGNIVSIQKQIMNRNPQNTVRDGDLIVAVDIVWRDLRDGKILSSPRKGRVPGAGPLPGDFPLLPFDPTVPVPPQPGEAPQPTPARIIAMGRYLPELGESNASAQQRVCKEAAVQIVSMMEKKWGHQPDTKPN
jgi:Lipopolysaccharide-assembly